MQFGLAIALPNVVSSMELMHIWVCCTVTAVWHRAAVRTNSGVRLVLFQHRFGDNLPPSFKFVHGGRGFHREEGGELIDGVQGVGAPLLRVRAVHLARRAAPLRLGHGRL